MDDHVILESIKSPGHYLHVSSEVFPKGRVHENRFAYGYKTCIIKTPFQGGDSYLYEIMSPNWHIIG